MFYRTLYTRNNNYNSNYSCEEHYLQYKDLYLSCKDLRSDMTVNLAAAVDN